MVTSDDLHGFLIGKLEFRHQDGGRHRTYRLFSGPNQVSVPTFPVVPRHSGDVSRTVLKSTASALGLNCHRLQTSVRCGICARYIYLCFAAKVVYVGMQKYHLDPATYQHVPPLVNATALTIIQLSERCTLKRSGEGIRAVESAQADYIAPLRPYGHVLPVIARWDQLADLGSAGHL
jgi:hypothetical protein